MIEINHFIVFVLYSGDIIVDVDNLYVKIIHLVSFSYIVIEDVAALNESIHSTKALLVKSIYQYHR
jgi:hypothetical protein